MSTIDRALPAPAWAGDRTRLAGSAYLALAGLCNLLSGLWLVWVGGSEWAVRWLIDVFVGSLGELGALYRGGLVDPIATWAFPVVGVIFLAFAAAQLYTSYRTVGRRDWRRAVGVSLVGSLNPVALPAGLVAAALLAVSRGEFTDGPAETSES